MTVRLVRQRTPPPAGARGDGKLEALMGKERDDEQYEQLMDWLFETESPDVMTGVGRLRQFAITGGAVPMPSYSSRPTVSLRTAK